MAQGKILIVNKVDGSLIGWFGETDDDNPRPEFKDIALVELEPNQYAADFIGCPIEKIKVTDIENKTLIFEYTPPQKLPTYEELQQQLLQAQGVI